MSRTPKTVNFCTQRCNSFFFYIFVVSTQAVLRAQRGKKEKGGRKREIRTFFCWGFPSFFSPSLNLDNAVFLSFFLHQQLPPGRRELSEVHAPRDKPPGVDSPGGRGRGTGRGRSWRRRSRPLFSLRFRLLSLLLLLAAAAAALAALAAAAAAAADDAAAAAGSRELFAPAPVEAGVLGAPPVDGPEGEEGAGLRLGGLEGEGVLLGRGVVAVVFFFFFFQRGKKENVRKNRLEKKKVRK